jgi:hypothetical protein
MISVLIAVAIADLAGCPVDEGNVHPCVVLGRDIGSLLYDLFVTGWFFLLTIPTGLIAAGIHLAAIKTEARWERESAEANGDSSPPAAG